jgi:hypothetical protein
MLTIPTQALPSQTINVTLGGQSCVIAIYQKSTGLFLDLTAANVVRMTGVLCHNRSLLVRQRYLGFVGDLSFIDTQGTTDPVYTGLGSRYQLAYLTPADLA